ncbi:Multimodular transpeptidase-transglycosylase [Alkalibacterium sp. AK22]|uniref:transglycosylase domain-containing protein n=1 Tax=Alkalibacterium sp. AK22 TaxID=1229520 RepID=UPI000452FF2F|nr:PBP1A family penicillin-binding protein [Alkalibacterium sp. AK22]EXJ22620.1 Multimodular transpeptidase-transglycosylase [Alkalibacterium sp. AK22]
MSQKEQQSRKDYKKNKNKKTDKPRKKRGLGLWIKRLFLTLAALVTLGIVFGASLFVYYAASAPDITEEDLVGTFSSELLDKDGEVFYTIGAETRNFASPEDIPDVMVNAVIAIEDQRFESHFGIDPIGIARAAAGFVTNRGQIVGGGSTVTQQLVKLSVFSTAREDQTLERKAQEAWLAVQLERQLSKEQIMTMYLNRINLGGNVYGVATASEHYFGKPASELEIHEAALFAGMAQAPNRFNPHVNPDLAERRRNVVINAMYSEGMISEQERSQAVNTPVTEGLVELSQDEQNDLVFDSFVTQVRDEIREQTGLDLSTAGLTVETNLDMAAQQRVFDVLNSGEYVDFINEDIQAAVSLVEADTGKIRALGGGRNQDGLRERNRATEQQTTGSTIKPLTTYGPAIEFLQYSTYHQIVDEEYTAPGTDWTPRNFDRAFRGQMSLRDALVESRNIPAVRIMNEDLDTNDIDNFLGGLGIDSAELNSTSNTILPQNAINGEMTPLEMAGAYAAFANGGNFTEPYAVSRVITHDGQEIDLTPETNQAMSDYTAYMITDVLKGVPENNSSTLGIPGLTQAGKTGTTNFSAEDHEAHNIPSHGVPDSWYVGYTPTYSLSVWTGFNRTGDGYLTLNDGTRLLPRHIYREIMAYVSEGLDNSGWTRPSSVREVQVENGSDPAKLPGPNTPSGSIVSELFVAGTEPTEQSTSYGEELSVPSGLSADYDDEADELTITWNAYTLENEDEEVTYNLTVGGQSTSLSGTEATISEPPSGSLTITLSVSAFGNTSPEASITLTIPERDSDEPEDDENEDEDETEEEADNEPEVNEDETEDEPEEEPAEQDQETNNDQPAESPDDSSDDNTNEPEVDEPEPEPELDEESTDDQNEEEEAEGGD